MRPSQKLDSYRMRWKTERRTVSDSLKADPHYHPRKRTPWAGSSGSIELAAHCDKMDLSNSELFLVSLLSQG